MGGLDANDQSDADAGGGADVGAGADADDDAEYDDEYEYEDAPDGLRARAGFLLIAALLVMAPFAGAFLYKAFAGPEATACQGSQGSLALQAKALGLALPRHVADMRYLAVSAKGWRSLGMRFEATGTAFHDFLLSNGLPLPERLPAADDATAPALCDDGPELTGREASRTNLPGTGAPLAAYIMSAPGVRPLDVIVVAGDDPAA
jgi:hypothetical protein